MEEGESRQGQTWISINGERPLGSEAGRDCRPWLLITCAGSE